MFYIGASRACVRACSRAHAHAHAQRMNAYTVHEHRLRRSRVASVFSRAPEDDVGNNERSERTRRKRIMPADHVRLVSARVRTHANTHAHTRQGCGVGVQCASECFQYFVRLLLIGQHCVASLCVCVRVCMCVTFVAPEEDT